MKGSFLWKLACFFMGVAVASLLVEGKAPQPKAQASLVAEMEQSPQPRPLTRDPEVVEATINKTL